jgi:hypothetical protein
MSYDEKSEKQTLAVVYGLDPVHTGSGTSEAGDDSDASSMISTPSTQVTGLGSTYTSRTVRRNGDGRQSDEYSTRPPSYYARSIDRRSSVSSTATAGFARHPVMQDGWFERLDRGTTDMHGE